MLTDDAYNLQRYVSAQGGVFETALAELQSGRKRSHWMWFVFPQMRGLGRSEMAQLYGIASMAEARAYLAHPLLGARLVRCTEAVLASGEKSLQVLFGSPDDRKFQSSMTLFALARGQEESVFQQALNRLCSGKSDVATLRLAGQSAL